MITKGHSSRLSFVFQGFYICVVRERQRERLNESNLTKLLTSFLMSIYPKQNVDGSEIDKRSAPLIYIQNCVELAYMCCNPTIGVYASPKSKEWLKTNHILSPMNAA